MTTVEQLSDPIIADLTTWIKGLLEEARAHPEVPLETWVERVRREGQRHLARLAEVVTEARAAYEAAPSCPQCAGRLWSKGLAKRYLVSLLGDLRVVAKRWRCPGCGAEQLPFVAAAEVRHGLLPETWRRALHYGVRMPYREAEQLLAEQGCAVSDNVVRQLVLELGGAAVARRRAEAEAVAAMALEPQPERWPERLYLLADGYKVRLRDRQRPWREARLALLFETPARGLDARGRAPGARWVKALSSVVQEAGDEAQADSFFRLVWPAAVRCGAPVAGEMVLLADGAEALWRRLPEQVPLGVRKTEILDFYHAAQNVAKGAKAVVGEGRSEALFKRWRAWLKAGDVEAVIGALAEALPEAVDPVAAAEVLGYLREHRPRMNYQRLKLDGYHIGSGAVESWCKKLLQRVRGPGMRWSEDGLEAILALGCELAEEAWNRTAQAA